MGSEIVVRGWRVYCSNRGRRRGCGRTFSALLSEVLFGFLMRAETLSRFVQAVLSGIGKVVAWSAVAPSFSLRSGYRLWTRLSERQAVLRPLLHRHIPAPGSSSSEPLHGLWEHLRSAVPSASSLISEFQLRFQWPLLG